MIKNALTLVALGRKGNLAGVRAPAVVICQWFTVVESTTELVGMKSTHKTFCSAKQLKSRGHEPIPKHSVHSAYLKGSNSSCRFLDIE